MKKFILYLLFIVAHCAVVLPPCVSAEPANVTVAGSLQSEVGCAGDWDPGCALTHLSYDASDTVWQGSFSIPAGSYEYKVALNNSWDINYGSNATQNGPNIPLNLASGGTVKFYYDDGTHWITDNRNSIIAVATGNFQSELGSPGDWDPSNLRSWLQDSDGNGIYGFIASLPAGNYEAKVAIDESWTENYGLGGTPGGANIPFTVASGSPLTEFVYDPATHILSISPVAAPIGWGNLQWPLSMEVMPGDMTENVYGQVWIDGRTNLPGATPGLVAELGFGHSEDPTTWTDWVDAAFHTDAGNNDEFQARLWPTAAGDYFYTYRYAYNGGEWYYAASGGEWYEGATLGRLTVPGTSVPEPLTVLLLGSGLIGLATTRRKMAGRA